MNPGLLETDVLDVAEFRRECWRRRPVVWRGRGADFLAPALDWAQVAELEERLAATGHGQAAVHRSDDGQVLFVNQAQHVMPVLRAACTVLADRFGWAECTADLSVTRGRGAGIGCHFDHSDNFVVQQQGAKDWLVGLPAHTSEARQRKRMLETKGFVPTGRLPSEPFRVRLEAGDVLYLPVFAPHEGVETPPGPGTGAEPGSVSVSFSCNAESALGRYLRPLVRRLSEQREWWEPLPTDGPDTDRLDRALLRALREVREEGGDHREGGDGHAGEGSEGGPVGGGAA
ncbi:cupin domain-containing protein [Streptomyces chengbuensis]|uniref:JmjC domain-containing protein n=1 Tax=Streptomyces chengbuensis TaxID=3053466 RepID=UPI0025B511F0|nr:cupin domain-containing protein [Streptomyces sp. HUAS CB01]WJY54426.1 cupin domain-containing protein [Streptomyces sp. HUAS CB01]